MNLSLFDNNKSQSKKLYWLHKDQIESHNEYLKFMWLQFNSRNPRPSMTTATDNYAITSNDESSTDALLHDKDPLLENEGDHHSKQQPQQISLLYAEKNV